MAAVRHLEFSKIVILVTRPISAFDSSSPIQISHYSANMAPIYSQIRFSIWRPSAILNCKISTFCERAILVMEIRIRIPKKLIEIG